MLLFREQVGLGLIYVGFACVFVDIVRQWFEDNPVGCRRCNRVVN
jgi:hypothetical protein